MITECGFWVILTDQYPEECQEVREKSIAMASFSKKLFCEKYNVGKGFQKPSLGSRGYIIVLILSGADVVETEVNEAYERISQSVRKS